ncbi:protein kinase, partial [bacterium]|nr:protein kinase [bacterium]
RSKMTQLGTTLGTAAYMSPEQARGEEADNRSDIWSLGVVLYEMISGQLPFKGDYEQAVIYSILNEEPEPLTALRTGLPIALDGIIAKALAKDPDTRYQNVEEMPADLKALDMLPVSRSRISTTAQPPASFKPARGFGSRFWLMVGLLLTAIAVALWGWLRPLPTTNSVTRFSIDLPEGQQFMGTSRIAISADGQKIAYTLIKEDSRLLYYRNLDSFDAEPIAGSEGGSEPFFSPDGKSVGFRGDPMLKIASLSGGPVAAPADAQAVTGADWGRDNTIVFAPHINTGIWRVSAAGDEPQEITRLDLGKKESGHGWPQFLPGGKAIIFTVETSGKTFDEATIVAQVLKSGQRKVLIEGGTFARYVPTGHLLFSRLDALYAVKFDPERLVVIGPPVQVLLGVAFSGGRGISQYAVSDNGTLVYLPGGDAMWRSELALVDQRGDSQPLIQKHGPYHTSHSLSPDGRQLAVQVASSNDDIWIFDTERETQIRLTFEGENAWPIWSPDGNQIIFSSDRSGISNLYSVTVDASGTLQRLTTSEFKQFATSCSPDGRFVAFQQENPETGWDIWLLPLTGDREPRPFRQTRFNEERAVYSPDGRWLVYHSDESGKNEVYGQALSGSGGKTLISVEGGYLPKWSPKENELFYVHDNTMMVVKISTETRISIGRPRALFELLPVGSPGDFTYDITPDGEYFVVNKKGRQSPLTRMNVVLNWFEELKEKMREDQP